MTGTHLIVLPLYLLVHRRWFERSQPIATSDSIEKLKEKVVEWLKEPSWLDQDETNAQYWGYNGTEKWEDAKEDDYTVVGTKFEYVNYNQTEQFDIMEIEVL